MNPTHTEKRISEEIKLITLNRTIYARLKPVLRQLAINAITAKANLVEGKSLYVSLLSKADNCWHVHKYPCRDILPALSYSKETRLWQQTSAESLRRILIDDDLLEKGRTYNDFIVAKCVRGEKKREITYTTAHTQHQNVTVNDIYIALKNMVIDLRDVWVNGNDDKEIEPMDKSWLPYHQAAVVGKLARYAPAVSFRRLHTSKKSFGFVFVLDSMVYRLQYNGRVYNCPRLSNGPKAEVATGEVKTRTIAANPSKVYERLMYAVTRLEVHWREKFQDNPRWNGYKLRLYGEDGLFLRWVDNGTPNGKWELRHFNDVPKNPPRIDRGMRDQFCHAIYQAMTDLEEVENMTERDYLSEATTRAGNYMTPQIKAAWMRWTWPQREEFCFDVNGFDHTQLARRVRKKPVMSSSMSREEYREYVSKQAESLYIENVSQREN